MEVTKMEQFLRRKLDSGAFGNCLGTTSARKHVSRQCYASTTATSTWIKGKNKPCGIEMLGMSTTHAQIYQSSSLGISALDFSIPETLNQSSALFAPAGRKRKQADVQEENSQIGLPFTIQVLRIALYRSSSASLISYERKTLHFHLPNPNGSYQSY